MKEELVDCPRCQGFGYRGNNKLCMCCCLEKSQGWTPGKVPKSMAEKLTPLYEHYPNPKEGEE